MSQTRPAPIRERPEQSVGTAVALALLFGPIGLAYTSRLGALVMLIVSFIVLVPILAGLHMNLVLYVPVWIVCVVWAAFAAQEHADFALPRRRTARRRL